jgi:hypothetical protein
MDEGRVVGWSLFRHGCFLLTLLVGVGRGVEFLVEAKRSKIENLRNVWSARLANRRTFLINFLQKRY